MRELYDLLSFKFYRRVLTCSVHFNVKYYVRRVPYVSSSQIPERTPLDWRWSHAIQFTTEFQSIEVCTLYSITWMRTSHYMRMCRYTDSTNTSIQQALLLISFFLNFSLPLFWVSYFSIRSCLVGGWSVIHGYDSKSNNYNEKERKYSALQQCIKIYQQSSFTLPFNVPSDKCVCAFFMYLFCEFTIQMTRAMRNERWQTEFH